MLKSLPVKVVLALYVDVLWALLTAYSSTQVALQSPDKLHDSCTRTVSVPLAAGAENARMDSASVIVRNGALEPQDVGAGWAVERLCSPSTAVAGPVHCRAQVVVCEQTLTTEAAKAP